MLATKRAQASLTTADDGGTFEAILSTASVDRDGESLPQNRWRLPASIPVTVDHTGSVADVVASGEPFLAADGSLRIRGRFANTDKGQLVRELVVGGFVTSLSVEFLRRDDGNELTGASFVLLPANPDAVVTSAKAFSAALDNVVKAAGNGDTALIQAIHDAAGHLGAECVKSYGSEDQFDDGDDGDDYDSSGTDDGANKSLALLRLRAKALALRG
ncbi:hypothetical protein BayCH28_01510 [Mycolicibacterium sp. CH28]|uniref:hypothetical protein n=1 Tax=Mycolicibacterium sp. CH28 TaxID=2512237 RepID=UPI0010814AB6|nr:hypothetical protein [Mycolicibacterium sp. CH28]TGD90566.1 hypothetical protein BayCH28_01510 [Mycolicibacterium sp. CH28]